MNYDKFLSRGKLLGNEHGAWVQGAYHIHKKRMLSPIGDSLKDDEIAHLIIQNGFADWNMPRNLEAVQIDHTTIGQNTTRKDIHNKTIYENDIVKVFGKIGIVEFNFGGWTVKTICGGHIRWGNREDLWEFDPEDIEIIGNIHDNPDILGKDSEEAE